MKPEASLRLSAVDSAHDRPIGMVQTHNDMIIHIQISDNDHWRRSSTAGLMTRYYDNQAYFTL